MAVAFLLTAFAAPTGAQSLRAMELDGTPLQQVPIPLRAADGERWEGPVAGFLERKIRAQWDDSQAYGHLSARAGVSLEYPRVPEGTGGEPGVPVVQEGSLPVRGRVLLPPAGASRRIAILIDASQSADRITMLREAGREIVRVRVGDAALQTAAELVRALVLEQSMLGGRHLDYRPAEVAVAVFGESSGWLVHPGTSLREALAILDRTDRQSLPSVGRSDAICALRLASDWLGDPEAPRQRDVVLLTDGDLPFSNRFTDCSRLADARERALCLDDLNRSPCPGVRSLDRAEGSSDVAQILGLVRDGRTRFRIFPVLFQNTRPPRYLREIASQGSGRLIRVGLDRGPRAAVEELLDADEPLHQVDRLAVRNVQSQMEVATRVRGPEGSFECDVSLVDGANDIEVDLFSGDERLGRYRFRVQRVADPGGEFLEELRDGNRKLLARVEENATRIREERRQRAEQLRRARRVRIEVAAPAGSADEEVASP